MEEVTRLTIIRLFEGGAIYTNDNSPITMTGGTYLLLGNTASSNGGAFNTDAQSSIIMNEGSYSFIGNTAGNVGGALFISNNNTIELNNGSYSFTSNYADRGGAIYIDGTLNPVSLRINTANPVTFDPGSNPRGRTGNNDIGCDDAAGASCTLTKQNIGILTLNTNNRYWFGHTDVSNGSMIVGAGRDDAQATWGGANLNTATPDSTKGNLTVRTGATYGGFGQSFAQNAVFQDGTILKVGITQARDENTPTLDVRSPTAGTLTIGNNVQVAVMPGCSYAQGTKSYLLTAQTNRIGTFLAPADTALNHFTLIHGANEVRLQVKTEKFRDIFTQGPLVSIAQALDVGINSGLVGTGSDGEEVLSRLYPLAKGQLEHAVATLSGKAHLNTSALAQASVHEALQTIDHQTNAFQVQMLGASMDSALKQSYTRLLSFHGNTLQELQGYMQQGQLPLRK